MLSGVGEEFTLLGAEHPGLYVEDEDNVGSVRKLGSQYNADADVYTRSNGVTCYETDSVSVKTQGAAYTSKLYISTGGVYRELTQTLYTEGSTKTYYNRSNGAFRYTTNRVDTPLYTDGGTHTYTMYKRYGDKVYNAGKKAVIAPAEVTTQSVSALTV